ncbi:hypothetical protein GCM10022406_24620 [Hymenobacter algoricola]|uniref:Uncharacterized protein n=1 Tax=Hymenobacter algoricola TaxID=486267 RepID=A0ABP7NAC4_9BACT
MLLAVLLVAGQGVVGQGHAAFIAPGTFDERTRNPTLRYEPGDHPGSYRGLDGIWHPVQIADWLVDRVYMNDSGNYYQAFSPEDMTAFVQRGFNDTIVTVKGLAPGKLGRYPTAFGRQLFRGAGMQLVDIQLESRSLLELLVLPHQLFIRKNSEGWLLVPRQKAAFRQLMLVLLADDPAIVARLQNGHVGRRHLPRLLTEYADFRTTQFLQTASQPRP